MTEKRLGTGTGFACAKLSEVVARSERSLATVRMTDRRALMASVRMIGSVSVARFGQDDKLARS
jgi:hypothetical protein